MRDFREIKWVHCCVCGEGVPLCKADFAATGEGYWCWACSARETSPTLAPGPRPFHIRRTFKALFRALADVFRGPSSFWQTFFLFWLVMRALAWVFKLLANQPG